MRFYNFIKNNSKFKLVCKGAAAIGMAAIVTFQNSSCSIEQKNEKDDDNQNTTTSAVTTTLEVTEPVVTTTKEETTVVITTTPEETTSAVTTPKEVTTSVVTTPKEVTTSAVTTTPKVTTTEKTTVTTPKTTKVTTTEEEENDERIVLNKNNINDLKVLKKAYNQFLLDSCLNSPYQLVYKDGEYGAFLGSPTRAYKIWMVIFNMDGNYFNSEALNSFLGDFSEEEIYGELCNCTSLISINYCTENPLGEKEEVCPFTFDYVVNVEKRTLLQNMSKMYEEGNFEDLNECINEIIVSDDISLKIFAEGLYCADYANVAVNTKVKPNELAAEAANLIYEQMGIKTLQKTN